MTKNIAISVKESINYYYNKIYIRTLIDHTDYIRLVKFSPNGKIIASCSGDNTIKLWDYYSGNCIKTLIGHIKIKSIDFSPNGQIIVSCSEDHTIKLWDINSINHNNVCIKTLYGHNNCVMVIKFSPDGRNIVSGSQDKTIKLWDYSIGKCIKTLYDHKNYIRHIEFSPNGRLMLSQSADCVILWYYNNNDLICIKMILDVKNYATTLFSPDGQIIITCHEDVSIKLWNVNNINDISCIKTLIGHNDRVHSAEFSSDGQYIMSRAYGTIKLWKCEMMGDPIYEITNIRTINDIKCAMFFTGFLQDGKTIIYISTIYNNPSIIDEIKLLDCTNGILIKTIKGFEYNIYNTKISIDGQNIVVLSLNNDIQLLYI
jgi:WD40 repeat protein